MRPQTWIKELSAATADLGTFLPLCLGLVVVAGMDPVGLLFGFGVFALATAIFYRRPIPVQPMKAVAAMGIAGIAGPDVLIATGVLLGIALVLLSFTDAIGFLKRLVPKTVLHGMRLALGITLCLMVFDLSIASHLSVLLLGLLMIAMLRTQIGAIASITIIILGWFALADFPLVGSLKLGLYLPEIKLPQLPALVSSFETVFFPQLALTLTNALILTSVVAQEYFPADGEKLTERRFAFSSGVANILLAPIGAMPMCHGAGGLAAYHGFGSKTGWSVGLFGAICLGGAVFLGDQMITLMSAIPDEVVAVLLLYAAWVLADPVAILRVRRSCLWVIAMMVIITLMAGPMFALLAGMGLEHFRSRFFESRRLASR